MRNQDEPTARQESSVNFYDDSKLTSGFLPVPITKN